MMLQSVDLYLVCRERHWSRTILKALLEIICTKFWREKTITVCRQWIIIWDGVSVSSRIRLNEDRPIGFLERDGSLVVLFWGSTKKNHLAENEFHKNEFFTRILDVERSQLLDSQLNISDFETLNELDKIIFLDSIETNSTHEIYILGGKTQSRNALELYNFMISKSNTNRYYKSYNVSQKVYPTITAKAGYQLDATTRSLIG